MSGIRLVESGRDLASGFLKFPELVRHLESRLASRQTEKDLTDLIKSIKEFTSSPQYSVEERQALTRIRQRAYDRKRRSTCQTLPETKLPETRWPDLAPPIRIPIIPDSICQKPEPPRPQALPDPKVEARPKIETIQITNLEKENNMVPCSMPSTEKKQETTKSQVMNNDFMEGINRAVAKIDSEALILAVGRLILPVMFTILVSYFLWSQSVVLYAASGFSNPEMIALGGLIMVMGFAGFHACSRSKLALLCCLYAGGYETYFIAAGTVADELHSKIQNPAIVQETKWREEEVTRAREDYEQKKAHFEDPSDKVHQNQWFKTKYLDPAWVNYSTAQKNLSNHSEASLEKSSFDHVGWLKIFYRLGLVFLCMLLVHRVFSTLHPKNSHSIA